MHNFWRIGLKPILRETPFRQRTGFEVLDNDIGLTKQLAQNAPSLRGLQVERYALFVTIDAKKISGLIISERRTPGPCIVAPPWLLNLDNLRAHVAQIHGAKRARKNAGEI